MWRPGRRNRGERHFRCSGACRRRTFVCNLLICNGGERGIRNLELLMESATCRFLIAGSAICAMAAVAYCTLLHAGWDWPEGHESGVCAPRQPAKSAVCRLTPLLSPRSTASSPTSRNSGQRIGSGLRRRLHHARVGRNRRVGRPVHGVDISGNPILRQMIEVAKSLSATLDVAIQSQAVRKLVERPPWAACLPLIPTKGHPFGGSRRRWRDRQNTRHDMACLQVSPGLLSS